MKRRIIIMFSMIVLFSCIIIFSRINEDRTTSGPAIQSVSLNKASDVMLVGETATLTATVLPENVSNKSVTWSSSATAVATVSESGLLTGVSEGTSVITATTTVGKVISSFDIDVVAAPKNVIIMISDGMGYNHVAAADYYQYGAYGTQIYESFTEKYGLSTFSAGGSYDASSAWSGFDYVMSNCTDSSAASTAIATGVKTVNKYLGVDADKKALKNISEYFEEHGKSTGIVTSAVFCDATPAGFVAHNADRHDYYGISNEMILSSKTDVIMGAGNPFYDDKGSLASKPSYEYVGGKDTWNGLISGTLAVADSDGDGTTDPWTLIQAKEDFAKLQGGSTPERVIGVAQAHNALQQNRGGNTKADAFEVPFNPNVPSLSEMARGALNVLDNDKDGFFLMVEGGSIDDASENNESGRLIEEQVDFNKAVEAVNEWVNANSSWRDTLLIVTADHETGYLTGPNSDPGWADISNNGAGNMPGMQWHASHHTNSLVPLYANGDAARLFGKYADQTDPVRGRYIDNTELGKLLQEMIKR